LIAEAYEEKRQNRGKEQEQCIGSAEHRGRAERMGVEEGGEVREEGGEGKGSYFQALKFYEHMPHLMSINGRGDGCHPCPDFITSPYD
jgi:hypothetical protein